MSCTRSEMTPGARERSAMRPATQHVVSVRDAERDLLAQLLQADAVGDHVAERGGHTRGAGA